MKSGTYFIYHGKEYMDSTKSVPKGYKILLSGNKNDLNDGFYCTESENFMKKFGFVCEKKVSTSEITEAYEIKTHAIYKGETLDIIGGRPGFLTLSTPYQLPHNPIGKQLEIKNLLLEKGFRRGMTEIDGSYWDIIVPIDDPDVELVEERTEIDISKL